jgi:hypothetical protein
LRLLSRSNIRSNDKNSREIAERGENDHKAMFSETERNTELSTGKKCRTVLQIKNERTEWIILKR